jgi:hypothetical protein
MMLGRGVNLGQTAGALFVGLAGESLLARWLIVVGGGPIARLIHLSRRDAQLRVAMRPAEGVAQVPKDGLARAGGEILVAPTEQLAESGFLGGALGEA